MEFDLTVQDGFSSSKDKINKLYCYFQGFHSPNKSFILSATNKKITNNEAQILKAHNSWFIWHALSKKLLVKRDFTCDLWIPKLNYKNYNLAISAGVMRGVTMIFIQTAIFRIPFCRTSKCAFSQRRLGFPPTMWNFNRRLGTLWCQYKFRKTFSTGNRSRENVFFVRSTLLILICTATEY